MEKVASVLHCEDKCDVGREVDIGTDKHRPMSTPLTPQGRVLQGEDFVRRRLSRSTRQALLRNSYERRGGRLANGAVLLPME